MIFSKLASELFPSIRPSVEYLAEEVPVPIPSADSEYVLDQILFLYSMREVVAQWIIFVAAI